MADFYLNNKTWDRRSNNLSLSFSDHRNRTNDYDNLSTALYYVELSPVFFGLVTLAAIFAVFLLVKKDHAAPVFIINLLISDLIQLCCYIQGLIHAWDPISRHLNFVSLFTSVGFMVCVSMERYLLIAKPLWYRFRRNIKITLMICAVVWVVACLFRLTIYNVVEITSVIILCVFLPLPFFIFFLVGTMRALSAAIGVPADEKRRIVAILVLMLLVYTLLFLPIILFFLGPDLSFDDIYLRAACVLFSISPLADSSLYILMRKGAIDKVFASLCCCKKSTDQQTSSRHDDTTSAPCDETV